MSPRTLFEKIWRNHLIAEQPSGEALLYVDLNLLHEGGSRKEINAQARRTIRLAVTVQNLALARASQNAQLE